MKILKSNRYTDSLVSYQQEFYQSIVNDYKFNLKPGLRIHGTRNLCYHKDSNTLLVSNILNGRVHLINLSTGQLRWYQHHCTTVRDIKVFRGEILTSSWDGTVRTVNFQTLQERLVMTDRLMGRSPYLTITPDGQYVLAFSYDTDKDHYCNSNKVRMWSLKDGKLVNVFGPIGDYRSTIRSGACLILDKRLYVISNSGNFNIFNLSNGALLSENVLPEDLRSMCLVPAYDQILAGDTSGSIHFYDMHKSRFIRSEKCHRTDVTFMKVHPKHPEILFSCCFDGVLNIWEFPSFRRINSIKVDNDYVWAFRFIGDLLIVAGSGGDICIYDIRDLNNITMKGKIRIFDTSYVVFKTDSNLFYTNDISIYDVVTVKDDTLIERKKAESLLHSFNNIGVLHEIFSQDEEASVLYISYRQILPQIPEKLS